MKPPVSGCMKDALAAARRMPGSSVKNSQKAVPDPSQAGPPALGRLPGALAEGLATGHLATGTAKLAVPSSHPHCALLKELPCSNSELDSWSAEMYISTAFGFRCFQRHGPVPAPKLEY